MVYPDVTGGAGGFGPRANREPHFILGQASMIHLDGWTWEEMELQRSAGMMFSLPGIHPDTDRFAQMMGNVSTRPLPFAERRCQQEIQFQRIAEFLESARQYQKAKAANDASFHTDLKLEAMLPVLDGKIPVLVLAQREREIRRAVEFAEKEKLKLILANVRKPGRMIEELAKKKIPVLLGPTLELPLDEDDRYDAAFTLPAEMYKAGVKFAFGSFGNQFARNLPYRASNAVAFGLPDEAALKAVTLDAAEIWGIADRVGSIDTGKVADVILTDGDPLETRTEVKHVLIGGKFEDLETKHTRLYQKYLNRN